MHDAVPVSVLMPPANFIVLVIDVYAVPPLMINVNDCPATGEVNALMVSAALSVMLCTDPLATLGAMVPPVVPREYTASLGSLNVSVVAEMAAAVVPPMAGGDAK